MKYGTKDLSSLTATWSSTTTSTNTNTGYFKGAGPLVTGDYATSNLKYAKVGSLIKFTSPDTREFLNGSLVTSGTDNAEDRSWAKIGAVSGDGANSGAGNLERQPRSGQRRRPAHFSIHGQGHEARDWPVKQRSRPRCPDRFSRFG